MGFLLSIQQNNQHTQQGGGLCSACLHFKAGAHTTRLINTLPSQLSKAPYKEEEKKTADEAAYTWLNTTPMHALFSPDTTLLEV